MKKTVLLFTLLILAIPSWAQSLQNVSKRHRKFVETMMPNINMANHAVLLLRKHLIYLHFIWQEEKPLKTKQKQWLYRLAHNYKVTKIDFAHEKTWQELLKRVDGLPDSLILAQAINESAWGESYFAKQGNNYFGQWCTRPGCGIVPRRRPEGATYEVKKYASQLVSIKSYIWNVNTNRSYKTLRDLRWQLRINHEVLSGIVLAEGMSHYSQLGDTYIKILQDIIQKYNFSKLDQT